MINKKKLAMLPLLTALITILMFANLNVASVAADPDPDPDTMTFNSDVMMEFETGNTAWIGSGSYMYVWNETKGENITEIGPGTVLSATTKPGWGYYEPNAGDWFYIYGTLYGMDIAFHIDQVWGPAATPTFNISETWEHWVRNTRNYTGANDFHETPVDGFEVEKMISTIETGVEYWAWVNEKLYNVPPTVGSCWNITYHDCLTGNVFNVSDVGTGYYEEAELAWYYPVTFGELRNTTGDIVNNITVPDAPDGFCPVEGLEGVQLIAELETTTEYRIKSPACLLPEDSWWNITAPAELTETQFHVDTSERKPLYGVFYSYMNISNINGSSTITAPGVESIEAVWAEAPNVAKIGSCDWFNVIEGVTPYTPTCWNITSPGLKNVTFCIDRASDYVFHIDEVVNATSGESGPVSLTTPATSITAEELTPKIYMEISGSGPYEVSIKTDYIFHVWSYEFTLTWNASVLSCIDVANGALVRPKGDVDGNGKVNVMDMLRLKIVITLGKTVEEAPFADVDSNTKINVMDMLRLKITITLGGEVVTWIPGTIDNTNGKLSKTGAKFEFTTPPAPQTHGPGVINYPPAAWTLATLTFEAVGSGTSDITLGTETKLIGVTNDGYGEKYNGVDDITGEIVDGQVTVP